MREVEEDIRRGEEKKGSNLDGEGDGDEPRCALKSAGQPGWRAWGRAIPEILGQGCTPPLSPSWTSADESSLDYFQG